MLEITLVILISSISIQSASTVTVKEYTATTSYQYISKTPSMYNGDAIWRLAPSSAYTSSLYYLEVYWLTFSVEGKMPNCQPDYVEVFVKDTTTFRSIGKYCSSNTGGIQMTYMYSIGGEMLIRYRSTQNSNLYLRYRLRSRSYSYMGYYTSSTCYNTYSSSLTGNIYSSGYPRAYVISSSSCYYKIVTATGKETRIVMMDVNLNCYHYVHIRGSYSYLSTYTSSFAIRSFTCSRIATIVTRYTYIHIRFYRSIYASTYYRGFLLSYIAYDVTTTPVQPGTCTFESDECGFIQNTNDHFNWLRHRGNTPSQLTGPSIDHTSGRTNGYYFYIESSSPRTVGHKSIISKQYTGIDTNGSCLTFWYHLYGTDIGKLNVYLKNRLNETLTSPTWSLIGEQGDRWEMGQITLTQNLQIVVFEGVIGPSFKGDIAIDDVSVASGRCPNRATGTPFRIQHRSGKLCLSWKKLNDELILTSTCDELYTFTEVGAILHIPSGKCLAPIAAVNNGVIKLQSACNSANAWFQHTSSKTIRHMRTGKCIQPYLGSSLPTIGTKLVIYDGCIETRLQFDFIYDRTPATTVPKTEPLTTTRRTSTTNKKSSTTTANKLSPTSIKLSTSAITSSISTGRTPSPTSTINGQGDKGNSQTENTKNDNILSISVIVIASIVCIILIALAIYFVTKCKRNRTVKRENALEYSNQNIRKAVNIYFNEPTTGPRPFSLHGAQRPLPEIPQTVNKLQCHGKAVESTNDIKSILRKQSVAIPTTFDDQFFKQRSSSVCETSLCSVPTASVLSNSSARPESTRRRFLDAEENAFGADLNKEFLPMKPLQLGAKENKEEMYLDLDEIKENVEEYRSENVYEPIKTTPNSEALSRSMTSIGLLSMTETSSASKSATQANDECPILQNNSYLHRSEIMSRMDDLECTLSGILENIQHPINHQKKHSLPNISQFNGPKPQRSRQGSCPSLKEPFFVANLAALVSINEENTRDEVEEEDYLAPSQIHKPLGQPARKLSSHDQRGLLFPSSSSANNLVSGIPTIHAEKLGKFYAIKKEEENVTQNEQEAAQVLENGMAVELPRNEEKIPESTEQSYSMKMPINEECQLSVEEELLENGEDVDTLYQPIVA